MSQELVITTPNLEKKDLVGSPWKTVFCSSISLSPCSLAFWVEKGWGRTAHGLAALANITTYFQKRKIDPTNSMGEELQRQLHIVLLFNPPSYLTLQISNPSNCQCHKFVYILLKSSNSADNCRHFSHMPQLAIPAKLWLHSKLVTFQPHWFQRYPPELPINCSNVQTCQGLLKCGWQNGLGLTFPSATNSSQNNVVLPAIQFSFFLASMLAGHTTEQWHSIESAILCCVCTDNKKCCYHWTCFVFMTDHQPAPKVTIPLGNSDIHVFNSIGSDMWVDVQLGTDCPLCCTDGTI